LFHVFLFRIQDRVTFAMPWFVCKSPLAEDAEVHMQRPSCIMHTASLVLPFFLSIAPLQGTGIGSRSRVVLAMPPAKQTGLAQVHLQQAIAFMSIMGPLLLTAALCNIASRYLEVGSHQVIGIICASGAIVSSIMTLVLMYKLSILQFAPQDAVVPTWVWVFPFLVNGVLFTIAIYTLVELAM
jgi:hypothetical protein